MAQGDAGGHFASSGGYGGNFPGAGGAAGNVSGAEHGMLGFGGMSPGGYNSTTYANNLAGVPGTPGFGARRANYQAIAAQQKARSKKGKGAGAGVVVNPAAITQVVPLPKPKPVYAPIPQPKPVFGRPYPVTGPIPAQQNLTYAEGAYPPDVNQFNGANYPDWVENSWQNVTDVNPPGGLGFQGRTYPGYGGTSSITERKDQSRLSGGYSGGPIGPGTGKPRQFGGPVDPGQQYTVGENGPETLQMGPGGGGHVIPHNPMDRMRGPMGGGQPPGMGGGMPGNTGIVPPHLGGGQPPGMGGVHERLGSMRPEMMQAFHQLMQQWRQTRPDMQGPGTGQAMQDWRQTMPQRPQMGQPGLPPSGPNPNPMQPNPMPQPPQMQPPMGQGPGGPGAGGGFRLGDWRNRMGIEGLSRPPRQPNMGFGGSGLGMPGIMPQMQQRPGFGG